MPVIEHNIWVPSKLEDREAHKVHNAVRMYDENLSFGRNENTGQWCIFLRHGTLQATKDGHLPILGFNQIPTVDEAMTRLRKSDARRRGSEILQELNKHNESVRAPLERNAAEASGETAEAFDWLYRKTGVHPFPRIFVPGG